MTRCCVRAHNCGRGHVHTVPGDMHAEGSTPGRQCTTMHRHNTGEPDKLVSLSLAAEPPLKHFASPSPVKLHPRGVPALLPKHSSLTHRPAVKHSSLTPRDAAAGVTYYSNRALHTTQWTRPEGPPSSAASSSAAAAGDACAAPIFLVSPAFAGAKPGYVFKCGHSGTGYYRCVAAHACPGCATALQWPGCPVVAGLRCGLGTLTEAEL